MFGSEVTIACADSKTCSSIKCSLIRPSLPLSLQHIDLIGIPASVVAMKGTHFPSIEMIIEANNPVELESEIILVNAARIRPHEGPHVRWRNWKNLYDHPIRTSKCKVEPQLTAWLSVYLLQNSKSLLCSNGHFLYRCRCRSRFRVVFSLSFISLRAHRIFEYATALQIELGLRSFTFGTL